MNQYGPNKDPENRSKKFCCCGGHNSKNVSRNLNHSSTKKKLMIRKARARELYLKHITKYPDIDFNAMNEIAKEWGL